MKVIRLIADYPENRRFPSPVGRRQSRAGLWRHVSGSAFLSQSNPRGFRIFAPCNPRKTSQQNSWILEFRLWISSFEITHLASLSFHIISTEQPFLCRSFHLQSFG
ncbi:hypothetical protein RvY_12598 [Ramazzottius varieornatus]|uniref:Uncharacterized protein n=1 Tax=Ramazzottius varieornatus TaxID=947166 RepID=A0A1D1VMB9_RAMVA|nr:hypothetical protein RvY_12598 [Ramazzottius varieornatus]